MSNVFGKKWANLDQPSGNTQLLVGGASLALAPTAVGKDVLSESEGISVNLGATNQSTPSGFITRGGAETLSESITQLTVV